MCKGNCANSEQHSPIDWSEEEVLSSTTEGTCQGNCSECTGRYCRGSQESPKDEDE